MVIVISAAVVATATATATATTAPAAIIVVAIINSAIVAASAYSLNVYISVKHWCILNKNKEFYYYAASC